MSFENTDQEVTLTPKSSDLTVGVLWREMVGRAQTIVEEMLEGNLSDYRKQ